MLAGQSAWIRAGVPRTLFFAHIFPLLTRKRHWMAHWGDWAVQQFNFRLIGSTSNIAHLKTIFGEEALLPREISDLSGYNTDPTAGRIVGFMCFIVPFFTFSVCFFIGDVVTKNTFLSEKNSHIGQ